MGSVLTPVPGAVYNFHIIRSMPDLKEISSLLGSTFESSRDAAGFLTFWIAFIGAGIGIGFLFGRGKLGNIFIDIYIALAVSQVVISILPLAGMPFAAVAIFLVILGFLIGIDQHLFDLHISNAAYDIFWRVLVMGILVTGMALSALVSFLPSSTIAKLSFIPVAAFASPVASVLWLSLPVFVLIFMNKRLGSK
jgi:hypothetical protein